LHDMTVSTAIKNYGNKAVESVKAEIRQLLAKNVWYPVDKQFVARYRNKIIRSFCICQTQIHNPRISI
jgi:hypothetical protein